MKFQFNCFVCFTLFLFLQVCGGNNATLELVFPVQKSAECLIEKVMTQVQQHCNQIRPIAQCIPEKSLDELMEIVKKSAECVHRNEKNYINTTVSEEERSKNFLECSEDAKIEVKEVIDSIDVTECPENVMEKAKEMSIGTCTVSDGAVTVSDVYGSTGDSSVSGADSSVTGGSVSSSMNVETTTATANE